MDTPDLFGDISSDGLHSTDVGKEWSYPPFSILNARDGWWQKRKRSWLSLGIKSEVGRESSSVINMPTTIDKNISNANYVSVFDPVLTELCYKWFCPEGGTVIDPFAGGSVRGIVASNLGYEYHGIELRMEQVAANRSQLDLCTGTDPLWYQGDSLGIDRLLPSGHFDFIFSCPPYVGLEKYSNIPEDLSNMDYEKFLWVYKQIIENTCKLLKPNSFACFVVGEVRDNKGMYHNFVGDTISAFISAGLKYYNEIILSTSIGSTSLRVNSQFSKSRKIGKTHQNVLVFVKGDPKKAAQNINNPTPYSGGDL